MSRGRPYRPRQTPECFPRLQLYERNCIVRIGGADSTQQVHVHDMNLAVHLRILSILRRTSMAWHDQAAVAACRLLLCNIRMRLSKCDGAEHWSTTVARRLLWVTPVVSFYSNGDFFLTRVPEQHHRSTKGL